MKVRMNQWKTGVVMLLALSVFSFEAGALPRNVKWRQLSTDHFRIVFAEQHAQIAQYVADMAEATHQVLTGLLNYPENISGASVILTDESDTFALYDLSLLNDPEKGYVILSPGRPQSADFLISSQTQDELFRQFVSQYTTVLRRKTISWLRKQVSSVFPDAGFAGWMDGGMAGLMETLVNGATRSTVVDMVIRTDILENRLSSLAQQAATGMRIGTADLASFAYGYTFMDYLVQTYGMDRLAQLNQKQNKTIPLIGGDSFKNVYGKSLNTLQQEWQAAINTRYAKQIQDIQAQPVTTTQPLSKTGSWTHSPIFSPDGQHVYYIEDRNDGDPALVRVRLADLKKTALVEGAFSGDFALSADGQRLIFSKTEIKDLYYTVSDVYLLDLKKDRTTRLTNGEHAFDPALAPDGNTVVFVALEDGSLQLIKQDLASGQRTTLIATADFSQIAHPAFSSDGRQIALQMQKPGGSPDIYVINSNGSNLHPLSVDAARDTSPIWGMNDAYLFFSSDRTGVANIFAYALREQACYQVTNVLTGVFDPAITQSGDQLALEQYSADGVDIHLVALNPATWQRIDLNTQTTPKMEVQVVRTSPRPVSRYNPLPFLTPKASLAMGQDEDGYQFGLLFYKTDLLAHHSYALRVLYGIESQRIAVSAGYVNAQFYPTIRLFGYDRAVSHSSLFTYRSGADDPYWERQQGGGVELLIPLFRSRQTELALTTGFEYAKLSDLTPLSDLLGTLPDEGTLGSAAVGLRFERCQESRYAISPEKGVSALIEYERFDEIFGSDFNINKAVGELNAYLPGFFRNHVVSIRAAGGLSDGDTLTQGVFQLGGTILFMGEANLWYEPEFYLRGYESNSFAGDRVVLGVVEYRFPIWYPQRTILGGRLLWDHFAGKVFFEAGDAWDQRDDLELKYSAGAELSTQVGWLYGRMPVTAGIGFAHGFDDDYGESQVYLTLKLTM